MERFKALGADKMARLHDGTNIRTCDVIGAGDDRLVDLVPRSLLWFVCPHVWTDASPYDLLTFEIDQHRIPLKANAARPRGAASKPGELLIVDVRLLLGETPLPPGEEPDPLPLPPKGKFGGNENIPFASCTADGHGSLPDFPFCTSLVTSGSSWPRFVLSDRVEPYPDHNIEVVFGFLSVSSPGRLAPPTRVFGK